MSGRCANSDPTAQQIVETSRDARRVVQRTPSPPFNYDDPVYRAEAEAARVRSDRRCQVCGRRLPLQAHHYSAPYLPADETTADALTALCRDCHDNGHDFILFLSAGGSPAAFRAAWSETVASVLLAPEAERMRRSLMRVGRAVWFSGGWAALVTGGSRPRIGEVFRLFLRSKKEWRTVVVTAVLGGWPGCWRVRKRFLGPDDDVRPICINNTVGAERPVPSAIAQAA